MGTRSTLLDTSTWRNFSKRDKILTLCTAGLWLFVFLAREQERARRVKQQARQLTRDEFKAAILSRMAPPKSNDDATAQIRAVADPRTAEALQNLQNLLYTGAMTDAEYQAAKDKLLGNHRAASPGSLVHIQKLAALHEAGVLTDAEFDAAKVKALDLV